MAYLSLILLSLVAVFSGAVVISIVVAVRASREHHNTIFPVVREVEGLKAKQARISVVIFFLLAALSAGAWAATQQDPGNVFIANRSADSSQSSNGQEDVSPARLANSEAVAVVPTETLTNAPVADANTRSVVLILPTPTPTLLLDLTNTSTPHPTATESSQSEPVETATPTFPPTATPTPDKQATGGQTALEQPVFEPAPSAAGLGPISFSTAVTDRREAIDPTTVFAPSTEKVYAVFPYQGMRDGLTFSVIWYYQGQEVVRDVSEWSWGSSDRSYTFIRPLGSGNYKVELLVGSEVLASGEFEIQP